MKDFLTLADVKRINDYTYLDPSDPTPAEKEPAYVNGDTWLNITTGLSYLLVDQVAGTWGRTDQANDVKITFQKENVFNAVIEYLTNRFFVDRNKNYLNNKLFLEDLPDGFPYAMRSPQAYWLSVYESMWSEFVFHAVDSDTFSIDASAVVGLYGNIKSLIADDTIYIKGSRRNDGYFTVTSIDDVNNIIYVYEPLKEETSYAFIFLADVPDAVVQIAARMVNFDIYRRGRLTGLKSESVGSYSWSMQTMGNGLAYPDDLIAGLDGYKLVSIGGESIFVA